MATTLGPERNTESWRFTPNTSPPTPPDADGLGLISTATYSSLLTHAQSLEGDIPLPPPTKPPTEVLEIDRSTPDGWVPRDSRLIRLTGVHPFNAEAPLNALYDEGFLTSSELFYVRNHGEVPRVEDEDVLDWEISIEGLVQWPFRLTLRDLLERFEQKTVPVTLVCAGNRRKEQNIVRKTKGFSWGAAGCSTALWTGVPLAEVIQRAMPKRGARYVCMEGADKLPNGFYGTSVKLNWALDPNRGIMLAHKMNGHNLTPDHGKPLRVVVPGQIGGRSVKWLKRLVVTDSPSENWYHIYDNRVLPTMISPEESAQDKTLWTDERHAIYDLSPNSAVVYPAHDETIQLDSTTHTYTIEGYAYSGGGRRVSRVELSLDQGMSWLLASISYPEDKYRLAAGQLLFNGRLDFEWRETSFCWCFWSLSIPISDLKNSVDVVVRAMDESMNIQPRDMYWSVLGMMNNPWYRLRITHEGEVLRFEHPTQPALLPGGWMSRIKKAGGDLKNGRWGEQLAGEESRSPTVTESPNESVAMKNPKIDRIISLEELREHEDKATPWFVVDGEVYDGAPFLKDHPGGATSIVAAAGRDTTDEFMAIHSETAKAMMSSFHIGSLTSTSLAELNKPASSPDDADALRPVFLDPRSWNSATLLSKERLSWDTRLFTFSLQHETQLLGLPTGQHIMVRLHDRDGKWLIRAYTPISPSSARGTVELIVKVYFDSDAGLPGGRMSQSLDLLEPGAKVEIKGPTGKFEYLGRGMCSLSDVQRTVSEFVMIACGTGITPIWQVLRALLEDPEDSTRCVVLYGNRKEEDILCRKQLDTLLSGQQHRCTLVHTLSQPPEGWVGERGRLGKALLKTSIERLRPDQTKAMVLICGPPAMEKDLKGHLKELGWAENQLVFF